MFPSAGPPPTPTAAGAGHTCESRAPGSRRSSTADARPVPVHPTADIAVMARTIAQTQNWLDRIALFGGRGLPASVARSMAAVPAHTAAVPAYTIALSAHSDRLAGRRGEGRGRALAGARILTRAESLPNSPFWDAAQSALRKLAFDPRVDALAPDPVLFVAPTAERIPGLEFATAAPLTWWSR